uniref:Uncharacterized protein n=1 Tax=Naja naja TaxID=35670 RepID=A0A8C6V763_NAJNA
MAVVFSDSWIISFLLKFNSSFFAQSFCSPVRLCIIRKISFNAFYITQLCNIDVTELLINIHITELLISKSKNFSYARLFSFTSGRFIEAQYQNGLILIPISNMDSNIKYGFQYQVLIPNIDSKCLDVLSYFRPESDNVGATAQVMMLGALAESLATKNQHLKEARAYQEKLIRYLEQQKVAYLQVLLHCLGLLKQLAREFRLVYGSRELKIVSGTYTPEIVNVHRVIRDKLQGGLSQEEQDLVTSHKILLNYEILGREFEELVKEYMRLQDILQNCWWVLTELNKD